MSVQISRKQEIPKTFFVFRKKKRIFFCIYLFWGSGQRQYKQWVLIWLQTKHTSFMTVWNKNQNLNKSWWSTFPRIKIPFNLLINLQHIYINLKKYVYVYVVDLGRIDLGRRCRGRELDPTLPSRKHHQILCCFKSNKRILFINSFLVIIFKWITPYIYKKGRKWNSYILKGAAEEDCIIPNENMLGVLLLLLLWWWWWWWWFWLIWSSFFISSCSWWWW